MNHRHIKGFRRLSKDIFLLYEGLYPETLSEVKSREKSPFSSQLRAPQTMGWKILFLSLEQKAQS